MTKPRPQTLRDIDANIVQFSGTENWYKYPHFGGGHLLYTDGVKYVADTYGARWLLDVIFSHVVSIYMNKEIPDEQKEFLACMLRVSSEGNSAVFTITDGNEHELARQKIGFTDFPALEQDIWVEQGVALLPSEH